MRNFIFSINKEQFFAGLGIVVIILLWYGLSCRYNAVIMPSPQSALTSLVEFFRTGEAQSQMAITFQRAVGGLTFGILAGLLSGVLAGSFEPLEYMLRPVVRVLLSVPAIIFAVMAMVWFGMGTKMAIFLVALLVFPVMHTNIVQGFKAIDHSLLEMVVVYQVPVLIRIRKIYFPALLHAFVAGFTLCATSAVRLTIMAELLGAREGIGQKIGISRAYLETEKLFAWVILLFLIVVSLEWLIVRPLNRFSRKWEAN
ncbi:MAG: ABC transporter permease [Dethiobacteria bacterium]|jgi:NitT/TauT family transport system permease protein